MKNESRIHKSWMNTKVNLVFYLLMTVVTFFSRKIFLERLGADFIGLTGTLQNILGLLNLAELGIGSAVSFVLYKPLREGDKQAISEIVSVFGYYYRKIGSIVLGIAVLVSLFFPFIFKESIFDNSLIYFAFYAFLLSSLIGYFINFRQILLTADQKKYVVTAYFQTANLVKILIQVIVALYVTNLYAWVAIELSFGLLYAVILNWKIRQHYPWLEATVDKGGRERRNYPIIISKTRQVFIHKFKDFLLSQSDQILVFAFVSLKMVAYYGNYVMVVSKVTMLFSTAMDGMFASVGNLIAENDRKKIQKVFWELVCLRFFIGGVVVFCVYHLMVPFIALWVGPQYILDHSILILLMVSTFIMLTRGAVDMFNAGYGNYGDLWAAWTEGVICLVVTLLAASEWGLAGILVGKIVSLVPIVVIWKPVYLYRQGFHLPPKEYWKGVFPYYVAFGAAFLLLHFMADWIPICPSEGIYPLVAYAVIISTGFIVVYSVLLYWLADGAKSLVVRMVDIINAKRRKS